LGQEVAGALFPAHDAGHLKDAVRGVETIALDVEDEPSIRSALDKTKPDCLYLLSAIDSISYSWEHPNKTVDMEVKGTLNILEAIITCGCQDLSVLIVGSGEEYGRVGFDQLPLREDRPLNPTNIYAASKSGQCMMAQLYAKAYGMKIVIARPFNDAGPGQSIRFALSGFCNQIARIEKGMQSPHIHLGNQNILRDFTDVRDTVRALAALQAKGRYGEPYNIGSGVATSIRSLLELSLSYTDIRPRIHACQEKMRPADIPALQADITKIRQETGWKPMISLSQTVQDTLAYCRKHTI